MFHFSIRGTLNHLGSWTALLWVATPLVAQTDTVHVQNSQSRYFRKWSFRPPGQRAKSPVPHSNFSAEKIGKQYHAQDIPYLLSVGPITGGNFRWRYRHGVYWLANPGSDPTRINVTINGVPFNDAESQGVYWVDLPDLAASAIGNPGATRRGHQYQWRGGFWRKCEPESFQSRTGALCYHLTNTLGFFWHAQAFVTGRTGSGLMGGKVAFTARVSGIYSDGYVDRASVANMNAMHLSGAYLDDAAIGPISCAFRA